MREFVNEIIIINGPSCAGKSTIAKAITVQSNNQFVHLQIDKAGEFYSTIFSKNFQFVKEANSAENNDDFLKSIYNNNRLARRKVIASIMLATATELLQQGFNTVIDTTLDGPDALELAQIYLKHLQNYKIKFVGIYCPVEERLKRLKTRTDNLFLTEDFIRQQTDQYNVFESCKQLYDVWFDSSLLDSNNIANSVLKFESHH